MKTTYKICAVTVLLIIIINKNIKAQYIQDLNGRPIATRVGLDVEGSPYLMDNFTAGTVKFVNGYTIKDVQLKYNQLEDELYFIGKNGDTLTFVDQVREFTIGNIVGDNTYKKHFKNGYPAINKNTDQSFYEVLAEGTVQFLKRGSVIIQETKEYNASTVHKSIVRDTRYYFVKSGQITTLKKDKKNILAFLSDKQPELESYIKANNLNLKDDDDLAKLITYYNSI